MDGKDLRRHINIEEVQNNENKLKTKKERMSRLFIIEKMIEEKGVLKLSKIAEISREMILNLEEKGSIVLDEEKQNILFTYPVSGISTIHQITLEDGRSFSAMCAIDSLGSTGTFHQDVKISSQCSQSGEPIEIEIIDGKLYGENLEDIYTIHVDLNKMNNWAASC